MSTPKVEPESGRSIRGMSRYQPWAGNKALSTKLRLRSKSKIVFANYSCTERFYGTIWIPRHAYKSIILAVKTSQPRYEFVIKEHKGTKLQKKCQL